MSPGKDGPGRLCRPYCWVRWFPRRYLPRCLRAISSDRGLGAGRPACIHKCFDIRAIKEIPLAHHTHTFAVAPISLICGCRVAGACLRMKPSPGKQWWSCYRNRDPSGGSIRPLRPDSHVRTVHVSSGAIDATNPSGNFRPSLTMVVGEEPDRDLRDSTRPPPRSRRGARVWLRQCVRVFRARSCGAHGRNLLIAAVDKG